MSWIARKDTPEQIETKRIKRNEYQKTYRKKNPEKYRAYMKEYMKKKRFEKKASSTVSQESSVQQSESTQV